MSFFGKFDPREKICQRIDNSVGFDGDNILSFMIEIRELMEIREVKERYTLLNLYCNWCLHTSLSNFNTIWPILEEILEIFLIEDSIGPEFVTKINEVLSMENMKKQILNLFDSENIPDYWISVPYNWYGFQQRLLAKIVQKPITLQFPSRIIEEAEKLAMGLNIQKKYEKPARIYCRIKNEAAGLMAMKLFLSDSVKGKRQGDVYWIVEITKQRHIMGRLFFRDPT